MRKRALFLALVISVVAFQESTSAPAHLMPMFEGQSKRSSAIEEKALVATYEKRGYTRQEGAQQLIVMGWNALEKKDYASAISQFNQAWLLDPDNADVYHGFALIVEKRDKDIKRADLFFRQALAKDDATPGTYVDYGRLLLAQGRTEESLELLYKALDRSPKARDARAYISQAHNRRGDFLKACRWAKSAQQNGDTLPKGFHDQVCTRADNG